MNTKIESRIKLHSVLNFCIVVIWIINGLFCKILNIVSRHELIVSRILGEEYSRPITVLIGLSEIIMAVWIISGFRTKLNAIVQIVVIVVMNFLEFIIAPDLLMWGRFNAVFAFILIFVIYINEFYIKKRLL